MKVANSLGVTRVGGGTGGVGMEAFLGVGGGGGWGGGLTKINSYAKIHQLLVLRQLPNLEQASATYLILSCADLMLNMHFSGNSFELISINKTEAIVIVSCFLLIVQNIPDTL